MIIKTFKNLKQTRRRKSHIYFVSKLLVGLTIFEFLVFTTCTYLTSIYEKISLGESLYLSVITVLTVGYGDLHPVTTAGRQLAMIISSTGTIYFIFLSALVTIILLEGKVFEIGSEILMQSRINKLKNHVIVCGLGRAGTGAINQLVAEKIPFVGIDSNLERCNEVQLEGHLVIEGEATQDVILKKAGIERAKSIIAILPDDGDNLLITLAAKELNKNIRIIARANRKESELRLIRAGADWAITLGYSDGTQLAMAAIKPATGGFVRQMLDFENLDLKLEEYLVKEDSFVANKTLIETQLRQKYDVQVLAIIREGITIANPNPKEIILPNDTIIIFGAKANVLRAFPAIE